MLTTLFPQSHTRYVSLPVLGGILEVGLIRFRGHFPREGYDVHDARDETETNPTQLH